MVFQMGHSGYKPRGVKHKATLEKEQRRAIFDARVSQKWEETIDKLKPEYIADQFLGKAPDELIVRGPIQIDIDIAEKNKVIPNVVTPSSKDNSKG